MNVASQELCKELFELSGWQYDHGTNGLWYTDHTPDLVVATYINGDSTPAYDLGYLLRKLPETIRDDNYPVISRYYRAGWAAFYEASYEYEQTERSYMVEADTPEDAAAKLAIELSKQGVLKLEDAA